MCLHAVKKIGEQEKKHEVRVHPTQTTQEMLESVPTDIHNEEKKNTVTLVSPSVSLYPQNNVNQQPSPPSHSLSGLEGEAPI